MTELPVSNAACVGGGVIGAGWAARLLWNGVNVRVFDPDAQTEQRLGAVLANAERALAKLTLAPRPAKGDLTFTSNLAEAVEGAELVQESAPERLELKISLLAEIEDHAPAEALICSSSSGLLPSKLQAGMKRPERFLIGHPFNPVYLLPLVEICGGDLTTTPHIERASALYSSIGMHPLVLRKEIDGFIADRLMEALWREALWLVHDDVASAAEVDDAIRLGAGLRWAHMGTFQTFHIAGGDGGMRHFLEQFGPSLKWPWTKLMDVPELDDELIGKITEQSEAAAAGRSIAELEQLRDDCLVSILQALKSHGAGAGNDLAALEQGLYARAHAGVDEAAANDDIDLGRPLRLLEAVVQPDWIDFNNHMTESRYLQVFGDATDAFFRLVGMDQAYLDSGRSYFTVETHIMHLGVVALLEPLYTTTQLLAADEKRVRAFHRLHHGGTDEVLASAEQMFLHVDATARKACPAAPELQARLRKILAAQADLPQPVHAGRSVGQKK